MADTCPNCGPQLRPSATAPSETEVDAVKAKLRGEAAAMLRAPLMPDERVALLEFIGPAHCHACRDAEQGVCDSHAVRLRYEATVAALAAVPRSPGEPTRPGVPPDEMVGSDVAERLGPELYATFQRVHSYIAIGRVEGDSEYGLFDAKADLWKLVTRLAAALSRGEDAGAEPTTTTERTDHGTALALLAEYDATRDATLANNSVQNRVELSNVRDRLLAALRASSPLPEDTRRDAERWRWFRQFLGRDGDLDHPDGGTNWEFVTVDDSALHRATARKGWGQTVEYLTDSAMSSAPSGATTEVDRA